MVRYNGRSAQQDSEVAFLYREGRGEKDLYSLAAASVLIYYNHNQGLFIYMYFLPIYPLSLMEAAYGGHLECVKALVGRRANWTTRDQSGIMSCVGGT